MWPILRYNPDMWGGELRKTAKNLSEDVKIRPSKANQIYLSLNCYILYANITSKTIMFK